MSVAVLDDYRRSLDELHPDQFIGQILWYTIAGARVTVDDLTRWFDELGLDPRYLPKPILPIDAFRVATSEARTEYRVSEDVTAELLIREVISDKEHVVRHIVREYRDRKKRELKYDPKIGEAVFYRARKSGGVRVIGGERVRFSLERGKLSPDELLIAEKMIQDLNARYHDLNGGLHSQALRGVVRNYVTGLNAIAVRASGGVYFIHRSRQDELNKLITLVSRFGGTSMVHTLPLLDTHDQRSMLTEAFQSEVEDEVRLLLGDIATANDAAAKKGNGRIPPATYAKLQERYAATMARSEEYTRVLGLAQGRAGAALEMALDAIMDAAQRIDFKGAPQ